MLVFRRPLLILASSAAVYVACIDRPATSPTSAGQAGPAVHPFTRYEKTTGNP